MPDYEPENPEWDDPVYVAGLERLNAKQEKMIEELCYELAASDECPYYTDDGCPRPDDKLDAYDRDSRCGKHTRRGRFGAECWRLWAIGRAK